MKSLTNNIGSSKSPFKSKTLGLALAAILIPGGLALAHDGDRYNGYDNGSYNGRDAIVRRDLSGHVEVVHQVPGGVITVGADWGKDRRPPVVVERREVVEVERKHGHGWGCHKDREVTIIREEPRPIVTVIRTEPACPKVVVLEKHEVHDDGCNRNDGYRESRRESGHDEYRDGDNHYYTDGRQVSYTHNGQDGQYQYYKDANQVSETRVDASGSYKYYEDANQVSIQDNRDGRNRNVYVRK